LTRSAVGFGLASVAGGWTMLVIELKPRRA
jgi:hypothetical protein